MEPAQPIFNEQEVKTKYEQYKSKYKEKMKDYRSTPNAIAYRKAYYARPEVKAKHNKNRRKYYHKSEKYIMRQARALFKTINITDLTTNTKLRLLINQRKFMRKAKEKCIMEYSNGTMACACCGEKIVAFLSLDHINNDGNKHRKEIGKWAITYPKLVKLKFPYKDKLQVLCYNCNNGKRVNNGVCPHKVISNGSYKVEG